MAVGRSVKRHETDESRRQRVRVNVAVRVDHSGPWTRGSNVVCSTLAGSLSYSLRNESFDVVVVDEAAQALEAACWGAMLKGGAGFRSHASRRVDIHRWPMA